MRLIRLLMIAFAVSGQTPGTFVVTKNPHKIVATAGNVVCTFTINLTLATIKTNCTGTGPAAGNYASTFSALPVPMPGTLGTFPVAGDTITWSFIPFDGPAAASGCPAGATWGTCVAIAANGNLFVKNF